MCFKLLKMVRQLLINWVKWYVIKSFNSQFHDNTIIFHIIDSFSLCIHICFITCWEIPWAKWAMMSGQKNLFRIQSFPTIDNFWLSSTAVDFSCRSLVGCDDSALLNSMFEGNHLTYCGRITLLIAGVCYISTEKQLREVNDTKLKG